MRSALAVSDIYFWAAVINAAAAATAATATATPVPVRSRTRACMRARW